MHMTVMKTEYIVYICLHDECEHFLPAHYRDNLSGFSFPFNLL